MTVKCAGLDGTGQVCYLHELNRDARSSKHEIQYLTFELKANYDSFFHDLSCGCKHVKKNYIRFRTGLFVWGEKILFSVVPNLTARTWNSFGKYTVLIFLSVEENVLLQNPKIWARWGGGGEEHEVNFRYLKDAIRNAGFQLVNIQFCLQCLL
jgi:hypothetical protein